jgi:hypothetical protein
MGRMLEDINPRHILLCGVPRTVAPRYTALHKVYVWCGGGAGKRFEGQRLYWKALHLMKPHNATAAKRHIRTSSFPTGTAPRLTT